MIEDPLLMPSPRQWIRLSDVHRLESGKLILLDDIRPQELLFIAKRLQQSLQATTNLTWETIAYRLAPVDTIGITLRITPEAIRHPQGYELHIKPTSILIEAHDLPGLFYGVCTLSQLIQALPGYPYELPCLWISDYPDFLQRGVMLDISRDKVPIMETLLALVDRLAGWKINQLQLYTEHTFAYRQHPEVWANASPFTGEEILLLDAYCRERFIELVPNQNSFGHMTRWLSHPKYQHLAEIPQGIEQGEKAAGQSPFSLCPIDPASLDFLCGLYDELLPHFSSRMFNVGCDETFDLGLGRSKEACEQRGHGLVYLDFLRQIHQEASRRGRTIQFWADIVNQHPQLIPEIPKDCIALEWGYEADHPFNKHCAQLSASGLKFYVCPGTSSWCSLAGRTENALNNLLNAAEQGLEHSASGYLITDWGDHGHWQTLPISYLGFLAGAAYAWCLESNRQIQLPQALDSYAFEDPSCALGTVAYDLGNVYRAIGVELSNSSALFWLLLDPLGNPRFPHASIPVENYYHALDAIDEAAYPLAESLCIRSDAELLIAEFELTVHMLKHAVHRGLLAAGVQGYNKASLRRDLSEIIDDYRHIWLLRNRPGGLSDSLARLERSRRDYIN